MNPKRPLCIKYPIYDCLMMGVHHTLFVVSYTFFQCCGSGPFFSGSGFKKTDPDPDPTLYLDMFLMFSKINIFFWHFLTNSNHLMTLKIKDKKSLDETVF